MVEGWTGSAIVTPYVSALYHTEVTPAEKYFISNEISTDGYLNEYILATNEIEYDTAKFEWGIVRGNTTSWNNFESIVVGKNSVLSQRQKTIQNTNEVSYSGLTAINIDSGYLKYQIYNNNEIFKWGTNASVNVFINGALILENLYRYDNNLGIITFDSPLTSQDVVTVDVVLLSSDYISFGENTTTSDYKTYYSENGPWLSDDNVVVYVNNELQRGTYDLDKYSGSVIFRKYLSYLDKVNIFVKLSNSFKIAVKVLDYDTSVSKPINFAITYSTKNNLDKVSEYRNFSLPDIIDNKVNYKLIGYLYKYINEKKKIHLITKHKYDLKETLSKYKLNTLFESVIHLKSDDRKSNYIKHSDSILIDDSFAERKEVYDNLQIPVFGVDFYQ
jgi:hypothetical protein